MMEVSQRYAIVTKGGWVTTARLLPIITGGMLLMTPRPLTAAVLAETLTGSAPSIRTDHACF